MRRLQLVCQRKAKDGSLEYCLLLQDRSYRDVVWKARCCRSFCDAPPSAPEPPPQPRLKPTAEVLTCSSPFLLPQPEAWVQQHLGSKLRGFQKRSEREGPALEIPKEYLVVSRGGRLRRTLACLSSLSLPATSLLRVQLSPSLCHCCVLSMRPTARTPPPPSLQTQLPRLS